MDEKTDKDDSVVKLTKRMVPQFAKPLEPLKEPRDPECSNIYGEYKRAQIQRWQVYLVRRRARGAGTARMSAVVQFVCPRCGHPGIPSSLSNTEMCLYSARLREVAGARYRFCRG